MSHRGKPVVWVLVLFLAAASLGQAPRPADTPRFFPMAVWYGGGKARAPMLERGARSKKDDLAERHPADQGAGIQYRARLDRLGIGPARRSDLRLRDARRAAGARRGSSGSNSCSRSTWTRRRPGSARSTRIPCSSRPNGQAIQPESSPGYCRDHPGVRAADVAFYAALAARAKRSPAFVGWDLWSEPHVINWANPTWIPNPEFCFCPHTLRRFRGWLQKKYGTIEALNAAWYRRFTDLGPSRAKPDEHDPLVHRLHRLEGLHRRQAR